ncbi:cell division protein FtsQ [Spirochaetia bacterium]|nr:cell division protein FtsQ [Spirochaetia bacterium]
MSGDFIYPRGEFFNDKKSPLDVPEDAAPAKSLPSHGVEKGFKVLVIAVAAVLILELIWLFAITPCMPLSKIDVMAFPGIDRAAVLAVAGIGERSSFVSVNPHAAEKAFAGLYEIESARVIKRFPNTVKIVLIPRSAVAVSLARQDSRLVPVYFDRTGLVFKIGNGDGEVPSPSLPLIGGLVFDPPVLGARLPAMFGTFLANLQTIGDSAPELLGAISEIRINRKAFEGFDLVLYPVHNPVRIRLESDLNEETLRYVMLMLDVFASKDIELEEIDFRAETASYKIKEASSG